MRGTEFLKNSGAFSLKENGLRLLGVFLLCLSVSACGRPLTPNEQKFSREIFGETLNISRTRLHNGAPTKAVTFRRKPRPRTTCRELIFPPVKEAIVTTKPAAVALYNTVLFDEDWYLDDYLPQYPDRVGLVASMLLAHELTHVWQWQNRKVTGYSPLKAASEHSPGGDPYLFEIGGKQRFLDFAYEQQASIVEELVCCRALAPQAARTKRLHALVSQAMPISPLPKKSNQLVGLPWDGVDLKNICR